MLTMSSLLVTLCLGSVVGAVRWGMLGASGVAALGLTTLALTGPGLSGCVKRLWDSDQK